MRKLILSFGILLFCFNQLSAQEQNVDTTKTEQLDEVVVTAQFTPTSEKNAIYKVKIIDTKTITAKAATNLTDLLRQELHIDFSFNPVFGAGIELNGVSKENIKILIDGVPLIGRVNGVLNLNQISLDNIERIEVIEGPVSVFYGTNAMGGTINLITKKTQKKVVTGGLSAYYETTEVKDINAHFGIKLGKSILKFGGGYNYFNGLNTDNDNTRSLNWPSKRRFNNNFKFIRNFGNFKLNYSSNYSDELVKTLGEVKRKKATDVDYTTRRFDNSVNLQGKLKNNHYLDVTASYLNYDRFDTSYKFNPTTNSSTLIENNPNENGNYFNTLFLKGQYSNSNIDNKLNYLIGLEHESDKGKGNRILDEKQRIQNTSVFSSINYKLTDNFEIQPALRYTYNSAFNNLWSPALNFKYQIDNNHILRFAYGKGFRAPSIKELYLDWTPTFGPITYTFSGNKDLKLESSHSFNFYYSYSKTFSTNSFISVEPSFSYNEIKDLIGLSELINFERHYINLNTMKSQNYGVQVKYKLFESIQFNLGLSYLGRYLEYTSTFNSGNFMFTPSINTSFLYTYKPFGINLNVFYKFTGKRDGHYIEKENGIAILKKTSREGFNNLDISLQKSFYKNRIALSIGAKNIFDVTDIENVNQIGVAHERNIQLWGKSYFIKTIFNF